MKKERGIHDEIVALYARINDQKFYFRRLEESPLVKEAFKTASTTAGIDRDRTVCALGNKAANTYKAIRLLVEAELADDAYALCRVLIENTVYLTWMTHDDWISRIDTYGLSVTPNRVRFLKVLAEHTGDQEGTKRILKSVGPDTTVKEISKFVFKDRTIRH